MAERRQAGKIAAAKGRRRDREGLRLRPPDALSLVTEKEEGLVAPEDATCASITAPLISAVLY
jgi:hypothetical protein